MYLPRPLVGHKIEFYEFVGESYSECLGRFAAWLDQFDYEPYVVSVHSEAIEDDEFDLLIGLYVVVDVGLSRFIPPTPPEPDKKKSKK